MNENEQLAFDGLQNALFQLGSAKRHSPQGSNLRADIEEAISNLQSILRALEMGEYETVRP